MEWPAGEAGIALSEIDAIASHGKTVAHHPELRATLQIGDPSVIADAYGRHPRAVNTADPLKSPPSGPYVTIATYRT